MAAANPRTKASLFITCIIDQFYPEVGESVLRLMQRLNVDLDFPSAQTCCGQPAFNSGFWSQAKPMARRTISQFRNSQYIITPSGSCASMMSVFYDELFHDEPYTLKQISLLKPRIFELSQFIVDVLGISDLSGYCDSASQAAPRKVTYHEACHLRRELGVISQPRTLIQSLPGVDLIDMQQSEVCCGFGGTFSVKYSEISGAMLQDKIDFIRSTGADAVTACDASCLMHIGGGLQKQNTGIEPIHLAQLLDQSISSPATPKE